MPKNFEEMAPQEIGREEISVTSDAWRRGERPRGYEETSTIIKAAHARGIHMHDFFDQNFLSRRSLLILKAETAGLTQAEADEMVSVSKKINQTLTEALDATPRE